jgi:hypothetical protein
MVVVTHEGLELLLHVTDPETAAELERRTDPEERARYALAALRVGVLALKHAGGALDERAIREAGRDLVRDLERHLTDHRSGVTREIADSLRAYFDRQTGAVPQMVEGLVKGGGHLDVLLRQHLSADGSTLARTLVAHVGEQSPLLRLLSPEQKGSVLAQLDQVVRSALDAQRDALLDEFRLDNSSGALARLVEQIGRGRKDLEAVVTETVGRLTKEFSLDVEGSSLVRFKREVGELIQGVVTSQTKFQGEVMAVLEGLRSRRQAEEATTLKGLSFEDALGQRLRHEAERTRDLLHATKAVVGELERCKKGDWVLELGSDSAAPGERIVFEAKNEAGYVLPRLLEEMRTARANRRAQHGVFVWSSAVAPEGTPPFRRYGDDVVVVWDPEDAASDLWLLAGLEVCRALTVRRARAGQAETKSFDELETLLDQLEKDAAGLGQILVYTGTIGATAEKVRIEATKLQRKVAEALSSLRDGVSGLRPPA